MESIIIYCKRNNIKFLPIKLEIDDKKKTYLDWKNHGEKSKWKDGKCNFKVIYCG